jgi:hypothetical protein
MKIFKSYSLTWKQIGIFKIALLSIGIILGVYWQDFFNNYLSLLFVIAIFASAYVMYVSLKQ